MGPISKNNGITTMGKLKDDPKSRLERLAESVSDRTAFDQIRDAFGHSTKSNKRAAWENEALRNVQMQALNAVDPSFDSRIEPPLETAFAKFNLSPERPQDWRTLLTYFAFAHFSPKTKPGGRPQKWTGQPLCQLLYDIAVKRRNNPKRSNIKIYELLIKDRTLKLLYSEETTDSLKAAYILAKDPSRNEILALIRDEFELIWWTWARQLNETTSANIPDDRFARLIPDLSLHSAIEHIESKWPTLISHTKR